jgi:hypothetical protein
MHKGAILEIPRRIVVEFEERETEKKLVSSSVGDDFLATMKNIFFLNVRDALSYSHTL